MPRALEHAVAPDRRCGQFTDPSAPGYSHLEAFSVRVDGPDDRLVR
jgi:hypothetical protein